MSDALSFAEIDGQHAELLPARTVLSMFSLGDPSDDTVITTSACTTNGSQGVLGLLGSTSSSCAPAGVVITN